jgi:hypothetical protein
LGHNNTNAPLILKVLEIIFCLGQFRGKKGLGPLEKPREMPHYMFCPRKKITSRTFKISGALIVNMNYNYCTNLAEHSTSKALLKSERKPDLAFFPQL